MPDANYYDVMSEELQSLGMTAAEATSAIDTLIKMWSDTDEEETDVHD